MLIEMSRGEKNTIAPVRPIYSTSLVYYACVVAIIVVSLMTYYSFVCEHFLVEALSRIVYGFIVLKCPARARVSVQVHSHLEM